MGVGKNSTKIKRVRLPTPAQLIRLDLECKTRTNLPINHCVKTLSRTLSREDRLIAQPFHFLVKMLPFLLQMCYTSQRCENNPWHFLPLAKHIRSGLAAKGETNEYKKMDSPGFGPDCTSCSPLCGPDPDPTPQCHRIRGLSVPGVRNAQFPSLLQSQVHYCRHHRLYDCQLLQL